MFAYVHIVSIEYVYEVVAGGDGTCGDGPGAVSQRRRRYGLVLSSMGQTASLVPNRTLAIRATTRARPAIEHDTLGPLDQALETFTAPTAAVAQSPSASPSPPPSAGRSSSSCSVVASCSEIARRCGARLLGPSSATKAATTSPSASLWFSMEYSSPRSVVASRSARRCIVE